MLTHLGLLAPAAGFFVSHRSFTTPLTFDVSAWYAAVSVWTLRLIVGVAVYGFHTALGGRTLIEDEPLEH